MIVKSDRRALNFGTDTMARSVHQMLRFHPVSVWSQGTWIATEHHLPKAPKPRIRRFVIHQPAPKPTSALRRTAARVLIAVAHRLSDDC